VFEQLNELPVRVIPLTATLTSRGGDVLRLMGLWLRLRLRLRPSVHVGLGPGLRLSLRVVVSAATAVTGCSWGCGRGVVGEVGLVASVEAEGWALGSGLLLGGLKVGSVSVVPSLSDAEGVGDSESMGVGDSWPRLRRMFRRSGVFGHEDGLVGGMHVVELLLLFCCIAGLQCSFCSEAWMSSFVMGSMMARTVW
jgi:hypothetical protein